MRALREYAGLVLSCAFVVACAAVYLRGMLSSEDLGLKHLPYWATDAKNGILRPPESPARVFSDCSLAPYKFTGSIREMAYWVRTLFREADFVDAKWKHCATLNITLLAPWLVFFIAISILFRQGILLFVSIFRDARMRRHLREK